LFDVSPESSVQFTRESVGQDHIVDKESNLLPGDVEQPSKFNIPIEDFDFVGIFPEKHSEAL
jgi:hypothetical protein